MENCPGFRANWRKAANEIRKFRREAEFGDWLCSYAFAPLYWLMALGIVTYYTLRQHRQKRLMDKVTEALILSKLPGTPEC